MPIYEYKCKECEYVFEKFQSVYDAPEKTCPACGGEVRKVLYPAGLVFKGSGFYITDSRKNSNSTKAEAKENSS
ncbi:MAG: hypothetical protein N2440_06500 [Actinobacteria bacterium]|nr:hypothetical protein [Actinomycetota bacterium]